MFKTVGFLMIAVLCAMSAAPAFAEPVSPTPLSGEETATLAIEDSQAIDTAGQIAAGMDQDMETVLTVAGVIIVAILLIWWIT